jgi:hypothetical protein
MAASSLSCADGKWELSWERVLVGVIIDWPEENDNT